MLRRDGRGVPCAGLWYGTKQAPGGRRKDTGNGRTRSTGGRTVQVSATGGRVARAAGTASSGTSLGDAVADLRTGPRERWKCPSTRTWLEKINEPEAPRGLMPARWDMLSGARQNRLYCKESRPHAGGRSEPVRSCGPEGARYEEKVKPVGTQAVRCRRAQSGESASRDSAGKCRLSNVPGDLPCINVHAAAGWVLRSWNLVTRPRSRFASNVRVCQSFDRERSPTSHDVPETGSRSRAHAARFVKRQVSL